MEQFVRYIVEAWSERYEYWAMTMEPSETMFGTPVTSYETEEAGRARLVELQGRYAEGKYRLVKQTVTNEVI